MQNNSSDNSKNDEKLKNSLIVVGDFATTLGIDFAKQSIEFIKHTEENIRISFVSSSESVVSRRIFCTTTHEPGNLVPLSNMFDSLSIPIREENLLETSKDCDSEFERYAINMRSFIKEMKLRSDRTYVIFNGRVY